MFVKRNNDQTLRKKNMREKKRMFGILQIYNTQNTDLFLENLLACIYKRVADDNEHTWYLVG